MSNFKKGDRVVITIATTIDEYEEFGDNESDFDNAPFVCIRYGSGHTVELPRYRVAGTEISVKPLESKADTPDTESEV